MTERSLNDRRRLELQDRKSDPVANQEIVSETQQVSVLRDAAGLKEAALKASNGGKKRIVGLYLPDGNRIVTEEKKTEEQKKQQDKKQSITAISKKDFHEDMRRKKSNLSEVAHTYGATREHRKHRALKEKKAEDDIDDEQAKIRARKFLDQSNEIEKKNFHNLFDFFDVDKDRTWGSIEFAQRMTDIGFPTGVEDAANLLYFAGVRDVDRITYNDFLAMMPKLKAFRRIIEKDAMRVFSTKDPGTGYIKLNDLRDVMHEIAGPEGADKAFVEAVVKKADRERTGRIPFDFFIRALFGTPPLIPYKRDMRNKSFSERLMANLGRCCGAGKNDLPPPTDDEDEEDDRA